MTCHDDNQRDKPRRFNWTRLMLICGVGAAALVGFWLYKQGSVGNLPLFAILLLCPLMHLLMMGRHGNGGGQHSRRSTETNTDT